MVGLPAGSSPLHPLNVSWAQASAIAQALEETALAVSPQNVASPRAASWCAKAAILRVLRWWGLLQSCTSVHAKALPW